MDLFQTCLVPPPWRVNEGGEYVNDITGEVSLVHPLKRALEIKQSARDAPTQLRQFRPEAQAEAEAQSVLEDDPELRSLRDEVGDKLYTCFPA